jgi:hypothetical protein
VQNCLAICTSRGDSVCFRKGEDVLINSISESDCEISLYKDGVHFGDYLIENHCLCLKNLDYGSYYAVKKQEEGPANTTYFSVVDCSVQVSKTNSGTLLVNFNSNNAIAKYVAICTNQYYFKTVYPLTPDDINRGYILVPTPKEEDYVRVFFYGEYGRVSSKIQQITF